MAAKVAKEIIYGAMLEARREDEQANVGRLVEECLRKFIEGHNSISS